MHSFLNSSSQAVRMALLLTLAIVMSGFGAKAHELSPAVADLSFGSDNFDLKIEMNIEAVLRALDENSLTEEFETFIEEFVRSVDIAIDGQAIDFAVENVTVPDTGDVDLARISTVALSGSFPNGAQSLTFGWAEAFGPVVLRTPTDVDAEGYAAFLAGGEVSEPIAIAGQEARSLWSVFVDYIGIGFEHILPLGLDHILFVVGLFLLSTQLRPLLLQITAFTLAHTVTLALGMLGIVTIPGSIVEPIIAASIVYVAIENILLCPH